MRTALAVATLPVLLLGLSRCSSFTAAAPAVADAAAPDADVPDAGPDAATACAGVLCEGFDSPGWAGVAWFETGSGALGYTTAYGAGAPGALSVVAGATSQADSFATTLPTGKTRYEATVKLKVTGRGDGAVDLFALHFGQQRGGGDLAFIYTSDYPGFAVERTGGLEAQRKIEASYSPTGGWDTITLAIDFAAKTYAWTINGAAAAAVPLPPGFPDATSFAGFELGAPFVGGIKTAWSYFLDDVVVTAK